MGVNLLDKFIQADTFVLLLLYTVSLNISLPYFNNTPLKLGTSAEYH